MLRPTRQFMSQATSWYPSLAAIIHELRHGFLMLDSPHITHVFITAAAAKSNASGMTGMRNCSWHWTESGAVSTDASVDW